TRLVTALVRFNLDPIADCLPAPHGFPLAHVCTEFARERHVRNDGPLRRQETSLGLVHRFELRGQPPGRKPPRDIARLEYLVRQPVRAACLLGAADDPARRQPDIETAGYGKQGLAKIALERSPARE